VEVDGWVVEVGRGDGDVHTLEKGFLVVVLVVGVVAGTVMVMVGWLVGGDGYDVVAVSAVNIGCWKAP
jgi:hypothetical protein